MNNSRRAFLILRVVVGLQFVAAGAFSLRGWEATVLFNALLVGPDLAGLATGLAVALNLVGGLSLVAAIQPRLGALLLLAFLLPATIRHGVAAQHADALLSGLGSEPDATALELAGLARRGQLAAVAKNVALMAVVGFIAATSRAVSPPPPRDSEAERR